MCRRNDRVIAVATRGGRRDMRYCVARVGNGCVLPMAMGEGMLAVCFCRLTTGGCGAISTVGG